MHHLWLWVGGWHFYHSYLYIKIQEQYTLLHCIIQAAKSYSLAWKGINTITTNINIKTTNKYNNDKSLNHETLKHAVHYVTLQNTELTIYLETIPLPQIKINFFEECTYNANKYWPYLNGFLLGQEIINLGPVAPGA